jgi:hypothetical protein
MARPRYSFFGSYADFERRAVHKVTCPSCKAEWEAPDRDFRARMEAGTIRNLAAMPYSPSAYSGTCPACHREAAAVLRDQPLLIQLREIAMRVEAFKRQHPDEPLEKVAHHAVEHSMSTWREPDAGFRAYLAERVTVAAEPQPVTV